RASPRSPCATRWCRPLSTSSTRTPSATSTSFRTRSARSPCATRSRTRSASGARTAPCCSPATRPRTTSTSTMRIVVCVKQVPDTEARIRVAPEGDAIVETDLNWIVSPYDEFAIEEALRLRETHAGDVVLVTVGPERAQSALRTGLAMGADSALHVKDPLLDKADTLGVARALAAAVKTLGPVDLVLTGPQGLG